MCVKHDWASLRKAHDLLNIYVYVFMNMYIHIYVYTYGVATISRLLRIIGLFCKRAL